MIERINLIMRAKNITASQFADEINIQRSGMSHIMSGRNKPSLDFIMRVLKRYPEIDTDWLLFGKGEMYATPKQAETLASEPEQTVQPEQTSENQIKTVEMGGQMDMFSDAAAEKEPVKPHFENVENVGVEKLSTVQPIENEMIAKNAELAENRVKSSDSVRDSENPTQERKLRKAVRYLVFYSDHTFEEFLRAE